MTAGARPLRVLLVANDGLSAGHVTRAIAIARGLARVAARRRIALGAVLATTSQAHALLAREPLAVVALPSPAAARQAGLSDAERRRLVRAAIGGAVEGFGPDLIVVDTFPSGPHGELAGLIGRGGLDRGARCALVRRCVPEARNEIRGEGRGEIRDEVLTAGLAGYDLAVLAGDPGPQRALLPIPVLHVPPITLVEACDLQGRAAARAALGLPDGRAILVAAGGGGDAEAAGQARAIAEAILRVAPDVTPVIALGPLAAGPDGRAASGEARIGTMQVAAPDGRDVSGDARIRTVALAPLAPLLAAFDGAFAPAGYNTAHELARARVPAALFARPRPFDDQAGRAARLAAAGFAWALAAITDDAIAGALAWMAAARVPELAGAGADRAAEGLLDLATGGRAP